MSDQRKIPKKSKNICTWIRQRTSPYCFGVKTKAGNPAHCNRNDDIHFHFQNLKIGSWGRCLCRLKNCDMTDHFSGRKTYYFTADGRSATKEVLVNIDIDCHGSGSLKGAVAFAKHLRDTIFPNMYFETSTNSNGVHGYIVVRKGDLGDEGLNATLTNLDRWLKAELSKGSWDVEDVEVKGHAPEFSWGREKFELKTYKSGQLAKLPREMLTRADELRGTTLIAVDDLRRLKVPAIPVEPDNSVVSPKKPRNPRPTVLDRNIKKKTGSIAGRHFDDEELSKLKGSYLSLARELLGEKKLVAMGRKVVTEVDVAVFLMLVRFFTRNMNADGSLPTARWREMWMALHQAGDVDRAWCHHRYARIRNFLTTNGLLSWQDEDFVAGVVDDKGKFIPGRASKWRASEELMRKIDVSVYDCKLSDKGKENKEEGRSILYGYKELNEIQERVKEEGRSSLYGCRDYINSEVEGKEEERSISNDYNDRELIQYEEKKEERSILYGCKLQEKALPQSTTIDNQPLLDLLDSLGINSPLQKPRFMGYSRGQMRIAA